MGQNGESSSGPQVTKTLVTKGVNKEEFGLAINGPAKEKGRD